MKANKIEHNRHRKLIAACVVFILLFALIGGLKLGYDRLLALCQDECVIRDMATQVEITSGKMVPASTIAEELGLKIGTNLAAIDFSDKRKALLEKIPNLRAVRISRRLPDKVIVVAEERTPIARMGIRGKRVVTGRVVDTEGVVFICQRGTQSLPTIYEPQEPGTRKGEHVKSRTLAALRFIETCREPDFLELGVLDVDTSKHDFLVATLGNYSKVKILWEGMDESTAASRKDLTARLTRLRDAIRSKVAPETVIWNATIPGEIFADTQGKL